MRASGIKAALLTLCSIVGAALGAVALVILAAAPAQAAPGNDDFADRQVINSLGTVTGSNVDATREPDEPEHLANPDGHSVWYEWTAPSDGSVPTLRISLRDSDYDTTVSVYRADVVVDDVDLTELVWVVDDDDFYGSPTWTSRVQFDPVAGDTYYIAVDGYLGSATGNIAMVLSSPGPVGAIAGTVTDAGGPVEGVCVDALDDGGNAISERPAQTDVDGLYNLDEIPVGEYDVRFRNCGPANVAGEYYDDSPDLAGADEVTVSDGVVTSGVDAVLAEGGTLSGTVSAADPGDDLTGVCVVATMVGAPDDGFVRRGITDAAGDWSISGLDGGFYRVQFGDSSGSCPNNSFIVEYYSDTAAAPGAYDPVDATQVEVIEGGSDVLDEVVLESGPGFISGTVRTWATLDGIEDICVTAESDTLTYTSPAVESGAGGGYTINDLPPATDYVVTFYDCNDIGGYAPQYYNATMYEDLAEEVTVSAGHGTGLIDARMYVAGSINGVLTDIDGLPIEGACVSAYSDADVYLISADSDEDGSWSLPVGPGNYKVEFEDCAGEFETRWFHDALGPADPDLDLVTVNEGEDVDAIDQVLPDGNVGRIKGTVTADLDPGNPGPEPVEGMCVGAFTTGVSGDSALTETDADGNYVLRGLEPDDYIVLFTPCPGPGPSPNVIGELYDDAADPGDADLVTVTAGTSTLGIDAELRVGGQISGTVTADGAAPPNGIEDVCVEAYDDAGLESDGPMSGAFTDADGDYTIPGLPTGNYNVLFYDCDLEYVDEWYDDQPDFDSATSVSVTEGSTETGIDAALARFGTVSGTVTDESGAGIEDVDVSAVSLDGLTYISSAVTDENGDYTLGGLGTDDYLVQFEDCLCGTFGTEFWDNRLDSATADSVSVTFGADTPGIDAVMQDTGPVNTAVPTITGTTVNGGSLTVSDGIWQHEPSVFEVQWLRCDAAGNNCNPILGAEAPTYAPTIDDEGLRLRAEVTAFNSIDSDSVRTAATGVAGRPGVSDKPTITGVVGIGTTLTAAPGTWNGSGITYAYQWLRCDAAAANCVEIPGADEFEYDTTGDDEGTRARVRVTATNSVGSTSVQSLPTWLITGLSPGAKPVVTGQRAVGSLLTTTNGTWTPTASSFAYEWLRCDTAGASCTAIPGADDQTYEITADDLGTRLRSRVTASNGGSSSRNLSGATPLIGGPVPGTRPVITGSTDVGSTLTTTTGGWLGTTDFFTYQWLRCDSLGASCVPIGGADDLTYQTTPSDVGFRLRVEVLASGSSQTATNESNATAPIGRPGVLTKPTISGAPLVDSVLTATTGDWTGSPTSYAYEWLRCDATGAVCVPILDADDPTYQPTLADVGSRLRVRVTAVNASGSTRNQSAPTAIVS